jgi:hypothetical protein
VLEVRVDGARDVPMRIRLHAARWIREIVAAVEHPPFGMCRKLGRADDRGVHGEQMIA